MTTSIQRARASLAALRKQSVQIGTVTKTDDGLEEIETVSYTTYPAAVWRESQRVDDGGRGYMQDTGRIVIALAHGTTAPVGAPVIYAEKDYRITSAEVVMDDSFEVRVVAEKTK